jgi:uncharacterized membrane protein YphA (DoxX/SURF4 family)
VLAVFTVAAAFLKNIAIKGGFLHIVAFGGGALSIDAWRSRKSAAMTAAE